MSYSDQLYALAGAIAELETRLDEVVAEANEQRERADHAEDAVRELQMTLADEEIAANEDVLDLISDVRRGVRTLDELYAETIG